MNWWAKENCRRIPMKTSIRKTKANPEYNCFIPAFSINLEQSEWYDALHEKKKNKENSQAFAKRT